jgi:hypothetical protein
MRSSNWHAANLIAFTDRGACLKFGGTGASIQVASFQFVKLQARFADLTAFLPSQFWPLDRSPIFLPSV